MYEKSKEIFELTDFVVKEVKKTKKQIVKEATDSWLKNNDEKSYQILFEFYFPKLLNFAKCNFFPDNYALAEDCVIEAFGTIYHKTKDYYKSQGYQFSTWMYTICRNQCLGELKKKEHKYEINVDISDMSHSVWTQNQKLAELTESINDNYGEVDDNLLILTDSPMSRDMVLQKTFDTSIGLIENLDPISADLIKEKFLVGTKIKDLANKYNVGESYIKNHSYNGLKLIKERFIEGYNDLYETYLEAQGEFTTYFEK